MEYKKFVCMVEEKLNLKLEGGMKASKYSVVKNNGMEKTGMILESDEYNIAPAIYLEEFFEQYQKNYKPPCALCQEAGRPCPLEKRRVCRILKERPHGVALHGEKIWRAKRALDRKGVLVWNNFGREKAFSLTWTALFITATGFCPA